MLREYYSGDCSESFSPTFLAGPECLISKLMHLSIKDNIQNLFWEEEEGEEVCQELVQPDHLGSLVCGEDQLYMVSQLVDQVEQPSLWSSSPQRLAEVEQALQPSLHKS